MNSTLARLGLAAAVILVTTTLAAAQQPVTSIALGSSAIPPAIATLAAELNVSGPDLSAIADNGVISTDWTTALQTAYATGLALAASLGVDPQRAPFWGGQFAGVLVHIEREARTKGPAPFSEVTDMVLRDTRETLRLNFGNDLAAASASALASLVPLRTY